MLGLWHRALFQPSAFVTNSFGDLIGPIESLDRKNYVQITVGPNEFTDFEKFEFEHRSLIKTSFATNPANRHGTGITRRTTALRVMLVGDRRSAGPPAGPEKYT